MSSLKKITIWTDGSCLGNPGPGGWAYKIAYKEHIKTAFGSEKNTSNNKMELQAAIEALQALNCSCQIDLYTDSKYLKQGIEEWHFKWIKNNWIGSNKQPIANRELWEKLIHLNKKHKINWNWVKGHSNNEGNEEVDKLANNAAQQLKNKE